MNRRTISIEIIQKYAPLLYLHPFDNHRPISVHEYLQKLKLVCTDGTIVPQPSLDDLVQFNQKENYLDWIAEKIPSGTDDFPTGRPLVKNPEQVGAGLCQVPCYAKVFHGSNYVDIVYALLYEFNGCSPFRAGLATLDPDHQKVNFLWSGFGRHKSDWEHITVRIKPDLSEVIDVFYSQHSKAEKIAKEDTPFHLGSHPIAYSALNSHANYKSRGAQSRDSILSPSLILPVTWLKLVDITTTDDLYVYQKPSETFDVVQWRTWENVILVDDDPDAAKWLNFKGKWGASLTLENQNIEFPPKLPMSAEKPLHTFGTIFEWIKMIPKKVFEGNAPRSPQQQDWWREKEAGTKTTR